MNEAGRVLLTGGAGYIGTHVAAVLAEAECDFDLYDNFANSKRSILENLRKVAKRDFAIVEGDVRDTDRLTKTLIEQEVIQVIHLAGLKSVRESTENSLLYYDVNVAGTISLLKAMVQADVNQLVFSSSATVYGDPLYLPIDEDHPTDALNPYGRSKLQVEKILSDIVSSNPNWSVMCLRYFNPIGAHESGLIGEDPRGLPNNLAPYIVAVANGSQSHLDVFGTDYDTKDGTGIRDFIHVMDVADGHLAALSFIAERSGWYAVNLGTGTGYTVLEVLNAFRKVSGRDIPYKSVPRRSGDVPVCYASVDKAAQCLGWAADRDLEDMCRSALRYDANRVLELKTSD